MLDNMINLNFRNLFSCIKENQFDINGNLIPTTIFTKENLKENQQSGNIDARKSNTNSVVGEIIDVAENYVVILADNPCSKQIIYTIFYSKIIYMSSVVIYSLDLDKCLNIGYKYYKIRLEEDAFTEKVTLINKAIEKNYDTNKDIQFILNGIISYTHNISSVKIINTILIIENFYAIPLSVVDGFVLLPSCLNANNKEVK